MGVPPRPCLALFRLNRRASLRICERFAPPPAIPRYFFAIGSSLQAATQVLRTQSRNNSAQIDPFGLFLGEGG